MCSKRKLYYWMQLRLLRLPQKSAACGVWIGHMNPTQYLCKHFGQTRLQFLPSFRNVCRTSQVILKVIKTTMGHSCECTPELNIPSHPPPKKLWYLMIMRVIKTMSEILTSLKCRIFLPNKPFSFPKFSSLTELTQTSYLWSFFVCKHVKLHCTQLFG